jgi:hypothetical protein
MSTRFFASPGALLVIAALGAGLVARESAAGQTVSCTTGNGQNASCNTGQLAFALTVPRVVQVTLNTSSLTLINGNAVAEDYEAGFKASGSIVATAFADTGAVVTLSAATANFSAPAGVTKPASTLQFSLDGTTWSGLTTTGATVLTIGPGGQGIGTVGGRVQSIAFRTLLGYTTDPPGTYSLTLNLTITAP